jgi:hypothetical protein
MKYRAYFITILAALLLIIPVVMLVMSFGKNDWYCSPTIPRGNDIQKWEQTLIPLKQPGPFDVNFFDKFTVRSDSNSYFVEYQSDNPTGDVFAFELDEMSPGEPLEIGGGTLELTAIGIAYHSELQKLEDDIAYHYYDTKLQLMSNEQISQLWNAQSTETGSNFRYSPYPAIKFGFQHSNIEDIMLHCIQIFDSRTRESLTSGYSSSGNQGYHWFKTHIPLWHRTPIDIVLDVSYGPSKTFEFAPRAGEGFDTGNLTCRLLGIFEGVDESRHSSTYNNIQIHEFPKSQQHHENICFFFACWPVANRMPVTFEFLDSDGNKLSTRGSSTSGFAHSIKMREPLDKIALIRARYRTKRRRIVIHLPYVPGLPEQNNEIENLFDVYIPYVRLHDDRQFGRFLQQTLQLGIYRNTGLVPQTGVQPNQYPMDFHNVTIHDIAEIYAQDATLQADIQNDQLIRKYPLSFWTRIKQFLKKLFP